MRKLICIILPISILIIFIIIMLSGSYLKKPLTKGDDVPNSIEVVIKNIEDNNWDEAIKNTENLNSAWVKVIKRVQFSSERDEINGVSNSIARLRGAIIAKDKGLALVELKEAYEHWSQLAN